MSVSTQTTTAARRAALAARHPGIAASAGVFFAALLAFLAIGAALPGAARATCGGRCTPATSRWGSSWAPSRSPPSSAVRSPGARPTSADGGSCCRGRARDGARRRALPARDSVALADRSRGWWSGRARAPSTRPAPRGPWTSRPRIAAGSALGLFGLAVWGGLSLGPLAGELLRSNVGYDAVWALTAALPARGRADRPAPARARAARARARRRARWPCSRAPPTARASRWRWRTSAMRLWRASWCCTWARGHRRRGDRVHRLRRRRIREPPGAQPRSRPRRRAPRPRPRPGCSRRSGLTIIALGPLARAGPDRARSSWGSASRCCSPRSR